jgi:hypothetical protein
LTNQPYKNLGKFLETLERKQPFEKLKKLRTFLFIIFLIVFLTLAAISFLGVKTPGYQTGSQEGYRAGYHTAFNGDHYNVKTGLDGDHEYGYAEGYVYGYDEGYPAGQIDQKNSLIKAYSQANETIPANETNQNDSNSKIRKPNQYVRAIEND